jgi:hypothetical protein
VIGGHLGTRVSALLDGQLSRAEEERAWEHVHGCHLCRDLVEREGWIKTQLHGLSLAGSRAPADLKGALGDPHACASRPSPGHAPRRYGMVALGGGALGAACLGMLALVVAPGPGSPGERRPPVTSLSGSSRSASPTTSPGAPSGPGGTSVVLRLGPHQGHAGVAGARMEP